MEAKGVAFSHLLVQSMMVKRYWKPSLETVRGPTKYILTHLCHLTYSCRLAKMAV